MFEINIQIAIAALILLGSARGAAARSICYNDYGRSYYCSSGLSWGARLGIGLGVAAGVAILFGLCGYWRRRQIRGQFSKYRPSALPFHNNNNDNTQTQYANNPPPPATGWNNNPYGNNPAPPAETFQPSMAGQYSQQNTGTGAAGHEHGYEWEQARQQEEENRKQTQTAPPGYDVATSTQNTGDTSAHYAPPPGPPPSKTAAHGTV